MRFDPLSKRITCLIDFDLTAFYQRGMPFVPWSAGINFLQGTKQAVIIQPVFLFVAKPVEGLFQSCSRGAFKMGKRATQNPFFVLMDPNKIDALIRRGK